MTTKKMKTVLIVEDEPDQLSLLGQAVESAGMNVILAKFA